MAEYYRTIFTIKGKGCSGLDLLADVFLCVRQWAAQESGDPNPIDKEKGEWPVKNGNLRLYNRKLNDAGLSGLVWERQDVAVTDSPWRLSLRLATDGDDVEADIEIQGVESRGEPVRSEYQARPPSFLKTVFERFECRVADRRLKTTAARVPLSEADAFIDNELLRTDRRMPLVVVSGRDANTYSEEANKLQEQLIGLARVFNYDHDTAWNIAKNLPRSLRCYDGAVRLYSPGCSKDDISQQHPYWMREDAEKLGGQFWKILRNECVNRVSSHGRRRLFAQVRSQIQREETSRLEAKSEQLEQGAPESENDTWDELLDLLSEPLDEADGVSKGKYNLLLKNARALRNRGDKLKLENEQLRQELEKLQPSVIQLNSPASEEQTSDENKELSPTFQSVREASEHAAENFDGLRFLPNAFETAKSSYTRTHDGQADKIYEALSVLNECAQRRSKGGLGMNLVKWFKNRKVDLSEESKSTRREFADNRRFEDDETGEHILMTQHIKVLHNDIRIHVKWDKLNSKYLIGYIGEHLPTSTDPH